MNRKSKLKNSQLPKSARDDSNSTTVSKFFSQTNQIEHPAFNKNKQNRLSNSQPEVIPSSSPIEFNKNEIEENLRSVSKISTIENNPESSCTNTSKENSKNQPSSSSSTLKRKTSPSASSSSSSLSSNNKNTIKNFFNESGTDSDFETPKKQPKKTLPKFINNQQQQKKEIKKRKRQPKINSMLLRQEKMFSKMIVEQSIAENLDPDDMQLALALSLSEVSHAEECGDNGNSTTTTATTEDSPMNIKKLKKFEYKKSRINNDYDFNLFLPNKSRGKWGTKFTPLTLRNPEKQHKKLLQNVEKFLSEEESIRQNTNKVKNFERLKVILKSDYLRSLKSNENRIIDKSTLMDDGIDVVTDDNLNSYYVTNLFKPSTVKAGYLLKDYRKIPGRDPSPDLMKKSSTSKCKSIKENEVQGDIVLSGNSTTNAISTGLSSPVNQPYNDNEISENENITSKLSSSTVEIAPTSQSCSINEDPLKRSSPDLFADYDNEIYCEDYSKNEKSEDVENIQKCTSENNGKVNSEENHEMECYEKFSSDDEGGKSCKKDESKNLTHHNDDHKENSEEYNNENCSQRSFELIFENDEEVKQVESEECEKSGTMKENSINEDKIIDLTQDSSNSKQSANKNDDDNAGSDSDDSVILTAEYHQSNEDLNSVKMPRKSAVNKIFKHSLSEIYSRFEFSLSTQEEKNNTIRSFENNKKSGLESSKRSQLFRKCTSDNSFLSKSKITTPTVNNESNCIENHSQSQSNNFSQANSTHQQSEDDCIIILSDDEVNYSIRKAKNRIFESNLENDTDEEDSYNKSFTTQDSQTSRNKKDDDFKNANDFSFVDLISEKKTDGNDDPINDPFDDNFDQNFEQDQFEMDDEILFENQQENDEENHKIASSTQNEKFDDSFFDLKKLKAQYGILDERTPIKIRKQFNESNKTMRNSSCKKSLSESFMKSSPSSSSVIQKESKMKSFQQRFSSNQKKFEEFINEDCVYDDDFDEFDKLVYGSPLKNNKLPLLKSPEIPQGIEKLLTCPITFEEKTDSNENLSKNQKIRKSKSNLNLEEENLENGSIIEVEAEGKVYLVQMENVPEKPDFMSMDTSTLLKELEKYGLKPLKRKQAIIILEYIYNQTHPFLEDSSNEEEDSVDHGSPKTMSHKKENERMNKKEGKYNKLQLKDCFGDVLLKTDEIFPEIDNEEYYLPTNIRSKVSSAALPFHIAWFNLVKSSDKLRETLLHYEPIDLQEIYLFFKNIGYRYDPKDMKKFFDSRCIIFQYDLSEGNNNRHTRKLLPKKKNNTKR